MKGPKSHSIWLKLIVLSVFSFQFSVSVAQNIPVPLNYTKVYDFVDELLTDGVIVHQTAVRPYSRLQIANMLVEAQSRDSLLNKRQRDDLKFYLNVFALERDTISDNYVQYTDHQTFNLSLANPQFSYITKNKLFKMSIEPILGMDVYASTKGAIIKRWFGAEINMDIASRWILRIMYPSGGPFGMSVITA